MSYRERIYVDCLTVKNYWGLITGDNWVILCMSLFSNVLMFQKSLKSKWLHQTR
jgi:hypothetical protein